MSTGTLTEHTRTEIPGCCWDCGGPCLYYSGTAHGWRCRSCLASHVDRSAEAFAALDSEKRRKVMAVYSTNNSSDGGRLSR